MSTLLRLCHGALLILTIASCSSSSGGTSPDAGGNPGPDAASAVADAGSDAARAADVAADGPVSEVSVDVPNNVVDLAGEAAAGDTGGPAALPGMGQRCNPELQQGDQVCAAGLVCVVYGPAQGEGHMCTRECSGPGDAVCGSGAACGRRWQVGKCNGGIDGCPVCEIPCNPAGPACAAGARCVKDPLGTAAFYCVP
jgi:hypothetical protein